MLHRTQVRILTEDPDLLRFRVVATPTSWTS